MTSSTSPGERPQHATNTRREIWALEKELAEKNADDQDATTLKNLIDKSTVITKNMQRPSDQANASATFRKLTAVSSGKVLQFCRKTTACSSNDLVSKLMLQFKKPNGSFDWAKLGTFGAQVFSDNSAAKTDFMMGAIKTPEVKAQKERKQGERAKRAVLGPTGPELRPEVMDTKKQDDSNETSKLTETMYNVIEKNGKQPWVFYVLDHLSFAQTVENMFSVAMLLGNAKAALVPDDEWGMCVHLPERGTGGQRSAKPEQSQMVLNLNNTVWERMKQVVRPEQCLTEHRADIHRADDEGGQRKRARVS